MDSIQRIQYIYTWIHYNDYSISNDHYIPVYRVDMRYITYATGVYNNSRFISKPCLYQISNYDSINGHTVCDTSRRYVI